jgi:hypothetical protein
MSEVWKTKYGARRVRRDPPTLAEAILAAQGLSDDADEQAEIAASLMELPLEEVRAEVMKAGVSRKPASTFAFTGRAGAHRAVLVERKPTRRLANGAATRRA